ncbi:MAG: TonB-dependent receptor [Pseudomonadota bacterium]
MSRENNRGASSGNYAFQLMRSASLFAVTAAAFTGVAFAQDTAEADEEDARQDTVIVTGIRGSIASSQVIKQNSDVIVDAITASDIGALPDRSVSEALQRVPGVTVERFAGPNDPDHFAVEGSGVIVRGLPYVRSELNGRDVFAANSSGVLGFEDVSPELLGSVQVFKNQSADMVEGGIAGSVNLITRKPFDSSDRVLAFSVEGTYSDFIEETTPSYSGLWSDQWETDAGRFGLLASYAYSELKSRADTPQAADFRERTDVIPGQVVYVPTGGGIRTQEFDRERESIGLAGQWESPDGTVEATAQFLHSDAILAWGENVLESSIDDNPNAQLVGDFEFGADSVLQTGLITETAGWRGNDNTLPLDGIRQLALRRERYENDVTTDYGFNLKWTPTDKLALNFDAQYIESETEVFDVTVHGAFYAQTGLDFSGDGLDFTYGIPDGEADNYFQDPAEYFWRSTMDHAQDSTAESLAFQGDAEYDFDGDGFLQSVRFGARYSDRDTDLRYSTFNWGNVSEIWTGPPQNGDLLTLEEANALSPGLFQPFDFDNYLRGSPPVTGVPFYSGPLAQNYQGFVDTITPILAAQDSVYKPLGARGDVVPGTLFLPSEIVDIQQETTALYARADFAFDGAMGPGTTIDGNIGIRYVETDVSTLGQTGIPSVAGEFGVSDLVGACAAAPGVGVGLPDYCSLPAADLANLQTFLGDTQVNLEQAFDNSYENVLPSLNVRFDFGEGRQVRFGASKAMVRPQAFDLRSSGTISEALSEPGVFGGLELSTGNPFLEPIEATQLDLTYEWYFNETGSVTFAAFWKDLENFWVGSAGNPGEDLAGGGTQAETFTNNGVDFGVSRRTIVNADDNASLHGFEIAYNQFYDFLPAPFDGLGVQSNFTWIDAEGLGDLDTTSQGRFARDTEAFPRVSKTQFNLVGLYEKGPVQARLAWNWRDEFLLTKRDVIFPFASIYQEATGQLDASLFYDINDNFKIGVQGVNLLNDVTETTQTINSVGLRAPRSFNENDRRYSLILRGNF